MICRYTVFPKNGEIKISIPPEFVNQNIEVSLKIKPQKKNDAKQIEKLFGAYKGLLSSTDEFIRQKENEKRLEK